MKHIQLFEDFRLGAESNFPAKTGVSLGYFSEGGRGSHPAVMDAEAVAKIKGSGSGADFYVTETLDSLPQALACVFNDRSLWSVKGIPSSIANSIMSKIGRQTVDSEQDFGLASEVADELGYGKLSSGDITLITIIPNPKVNTIYWSDAPEQGGYWEAPYSAIPASEFI